MSEHHPNGTFDRYATQYRAEWNEKGEDVHVHIHTAHRTDRGPLRHGTGTVAESFYSGTVTGLTFLGLFFFGAAAVELGGDMHVEPLASMNPTWLWVLPLLWVAEVVGSAIYQHKRVYPHVVQLNDLGEWLHQTYDHTVAQLVKSGRHATLVDALNAQWGALEDALGDMCRNRDAVRGVGFGDLTPEETKERGEAYIYALDTAYTLVSEAQAATRLALETDALRDKIGEVERAARARELPASRSVVLEQAGLLQSDSEALTHYGASLGVL